MLRTLPETTPAPPPPRVFRHYNYVSGMAPWYDCGAGARRMVLSPHHQRLLMNAAREVIRRRLAGHPPPDDLDTAAHDPVLSNPAG